MGDNETYPIDFLLSRFSTLQNSNVHLVVSVLFAPSGYGLLFPLLVLVSKILAGNKQREGASDGTSANDGERDLISWPVFGLPHERPSGVAHTVGDQDYGVDRDAFCVT